LKVVDLDHWDIAGNGQSFGERNAYQKRAEQTRASGVGYGINLIGGDASLFQGCVDYGYNVLLMSA
jgi:hypothetical protein